MTDNKDLKYTQQFKKEPNLPKTYEQFILEAKDLTQQDLYPDLNYEDISEQKGYGPMQRVGRSMISASIAGRLERERREEERRREQNFCIRIDCQNLAEVGDFCEFHKRERSEVAWLWKTAADTTASVLVPGYAPVKAVVGTASWAVEKATGSDSDFGVNAVKDESKSEAWDAAATIASGSSKFGGYYSAGVGIASSVVDWARHQDHVNRGENYRSDCPVCR